MQAWLAYLVLFCLLVAVQCDRLGAELETINQVYHESLFDPYSVNTNFSTSLVHMLCDYPPDILKSYDRANCLKHVKRAVRSIKVMNTIHSAQQVRRKLGILEQVANEVNGSGPLNTHQSELMVVHNKLLALHEVADDPKVTTVCEIHPFGLGDTAITWLQANPHTSVVSFNWDLGHEQELPNVVTEDNRFSTKSALSTSMNAISAMFPLRSLTLIEGDPVHSIASLQSLMHSSGGCFKCNLIYLDISEHSSTNSIRMLVTTVLHGIANESYHRVLISYTNSGDGSCYVGENHMAIPAPLVGLINDKVLSQLQTISLPLQYCHWPAPITNGPFAGSYVFRRRTPQDGNSPCNKFVDSSINNFKSSTLFITKFQ